tara:strand:- start:30995 stop:31336 length:342 start_codon:yes stop_codon:yes gene_type:complete
MHWYYTEGQLTINIDDKEHKFSLEELISSSLVYKERRKKVSKFFIVFLLLIGGLQYMGGGFPSGKDVYFYIGYLATPALFSGILSFVYYLYLKYIKNEKSGLDSILKENLPSQ